ncbi:MAG: Ni/Fe-hydrogenase cytochrome b subunit [SAR324 cluster bacterium]|nr:Ni/Fe-hydrogenase cytochrome b subunit [SAR324 cluster bacterium]
MKLKLPQLTFWRVVAGIIYVIGLYATFLRFGKGLGASTNLSDEFPWGIWIGFDVMVGVGLAAGGFIIAATVHIFNLEQYKSIARPTILTAFLGYSLVIVALLFDLGRPYRIWHPLIMWNPHSVMFEVAWCVTLYTMVLALEFSPIFFERFNLKVPLKWVRAIYLPVVILGVILSTLHQSSLGTLYVIVPDKLHGLWYSPFLPVFFFITAIAAGLAMTIFESFLSYRAFGKRIELDILVGISRVIVVVLSVFLVLKLQDLSHRGNLHLMFEFTQESVLFWGELGLGAMLPVGLLLIPKIRENERGLFFCALLVLLGFILGRLNVSITGMLNTETYFPKWTEIAITTAIVTLGFTIFSIVVKNFPVFPLEDLETMPLSAHEKHPVFSVRLVLGMWGLLLIAMIALALAKKNELNHQVPQAAMWNRTVNPLEQKLEYPPPFEFPLGKDSPGLVIFDHEKHNEYQERPDCKPCHVDMFGLVIITNVPAITHEMLDKGELCGKCHTGSGNENESFGVTKEADNCDSCHEEENGE